MLGGGWPRAWYGISLISFGLQVSPEQNCGEIDCGSWRGSCSGESKLPLTRLRWHIGVGIIDGSASLSVQLDHGRSKRRARSSTPTRRRCSYVDVSVWQEFFKSVHAIRSGAVMCPAFVRGFYGRWP